MLKRLKINKYRHVRPGTELVFNEGFNVLLGKNGTGKTTLLRLVSQVLRGDFSELRSTEFDIEYELNVDGKPVVVGFQNSLLSEATPPDFGRRGNRHRLNVEVRDADKPALLRVTDGQVFASGSVQPVASLDPFDPWLLSNLGWILPADDDTNALVRLQLVATTHFGWATRFDESLDTYGHLLDGHRAGRRLDFAGERAFSVTFPTKPILGRFDFHIGRAVPSAYRVEPPTNGAVGALAITIPPEAKLSRFAALCEFDNVKLAITVSGISEHGGSTYYDLGRLNFLIDMGRVSFDQNELSYGQKRLLAFLLYLDFNRSLVVADELVNGMHYDWIRACVDAIGNRQAFLTSQNPLLFDHIPFESAEQVQQSFIQCRTEETDGQTEMVWSNLDAEIADQFFQDYEVGIRFVGEILRARGLW